MTLVHISKTVAEYLVQRCQEFLETALGSEGTLASPSGVLRELEDSDTTPAFDRLQIDVFSFLDMLKEILKFTILVSDQGDFEFDENINLIQGLDEVEEDISPE